MFSQETCIPLLRFCEKQGFFWFPMALFLHSLHWSSVLVFNNHYLDDLGAFLSTGKFSLSSYLALQSGLHIAEYASCSSKCFSIHDRIIIGVCERVEYSSASGRKIGNQLALYIIHGRPIVANSDLSDHHLRLGYTEHRRWNNSL